MKNIDINKYRTRFPNNNDTFFENLSDIDKNLYLERVSKYYFLFLNYIIEKLNLKQFDQSLFNSDNHFIPINEENMDLYQFISSEKLKYIYIRNNIYVERLSDEELQKLDSLEYNETNQVNEFIDSTYPRVISEYDNNQKAIINFGPDSSQFYVPDSNIIIGLRINQDNISYEEKNKQNFELDFVKDYYSVLFDKTLPNGVSIIQYDEYSTKNKENKTINK